MNDHPSAPAPRLTATHVSLFVAALSLCTAFYQGYLNTQAVGVFSRDVVHRETMRSCRDAVESFMESRLRIQRLAEAPASTTDRERADLVFESRRAVARFASVATYLANFNASAFREPYSAITRDLENLIALANAKPVDFGAVDAKFYALNENCVASVTPPK